MRRALALALLPLAGALLVPQSSRAGTTPPAQVGWWWRPQGSLLPVAVPAPPGVPDGGLYVAADPQGAQAIAALRFEVPPGARARTLTLTVADSLGDAVLGACAASSAWEPTHAGPWEERPSFDCSAASVEGAMNEDGSSVSFPVAPLAGGGVLDVVVVPGEPAGDAASAFQVSFEPPGADSLSFDAAPPPAARPAPTTPAAGVRPVVPAPAAEPRRPATPPPIPAAPFVPAPGSEGPPRPRPADPAVTRVSGDRESRRDGGERGIALLLLALAAGAWASLSGGPGARAVGRIAGATEPAVATRGEAGLGRFRRARPPGAAPPTF